MIMPEKSKALMHVKSLLKKNGKIYITQTIEKAPNLFMEKIKPLLKYFISIDFGSVTYEKDVCSLTLIFRLLIAISCLKLLKHLA